MKDFYIKIFFLKAFIDKSISLNCVQCNACSNPYNNLTDPSTLCSAGDTVYENKNIYIIFFKIM